MTLIVSVLFTSCLNDDEEVTLYDDIAITSFTLGTLNRYVKTTVDGETTTTKYTIAGSAYAMSIDQLNYRISNAVSLPAGTDVAHVVCTVSAMNNGFVTLMNADGQEIYFNTADSLDFTKPRTFRVYASDGSTHRDYTVTLNVTADEAEKSWVPYTDLVPAFVQFKATVENASATSFDLNFSGDGAATTVNSPIAAGEDYTKLPQGQVGYVTFPYAFADNVQYELIVGSNDSDDKACVVWRRITDGDDASKSEGWVYMPVVDNSVNYLPKMNRVSLAFSDGKVLAFGSKGAVFQSRDYGITWKTSTDYTLPEDCGDNMTVTTDKNGQLWLFDEESGRVWTWTSE